MQQRIVEGLASVVPGIAELELQQVEIKGGWIFAAGNSDIDNPGSELIDAAPSARIGKDAIKRQHGQADTRTLLRCTGDRAHAGRAVMSARVTIGVPVYRGERFLEETLRSIRDQTFKDFQVVMSVDGHDPACETICEQFLDDRRFKMVVQPDRLGWVGNLNWLLSQVDTEFWYYHQQDDLTHASTLTYWSRTSTGCLKPPLCIATSSRWGGSRQPSSRSHQFSATAPSFAK